MELDGLWLDSRPEGGPFGKTWAIDLRRPANGYICGGLNHTILGVAFTNDILKTTRVSFLSLEQALAQTKAILDKSGLMEDVKWG